MARVLPLDYRDLTESGKRLARVAACTPFKGQTPEQFADSYDFFVDFYLCRDPETEDAAGYYPPPRLPTPPFHRAIVADLARYQKHILIFPRFSGKSIVMSETVPMWLCLTTKRFMSMIVCSNTKNCTLRMSTIARQLTNNQRINDDFGVMKPARGEGSWSPSVGLDMLNGSRVVAAPITSKLHGYHPDYLVLDDIEGDSEDSSLGLNDPVRIRSNIEHSLFRTLLPTLRPGKVCVWIGTSHSQQTLIYRAYADDRDPRWRSWNKSKRAIYWQNDAGDTEHLWKEMYSPEFVEKQRKELGPSAFAAEFLGEPASDQDRLLLFNDKNHQYWCIDGPHPSDESCPLESRTTIAWSEPTKRDPDHSTVEQQPAGGEHGLFPKMYRILVVDWARTITNTSDYSCVMVVGVDTRRHWWLLDNWVGRVTQDKLIELIYHYGRKWRVQVVGVEAASIGKQINERVYTDLVEARDWPVRVRPIKHTESKEDRIASMEWRFTRNFIHFPGDLMARRPWKMLKDQVDNFTPDLKNLAHDDCVDCLSFVNAVHRSPKAVADRESKHYNIVEKLLAGETTLGSTDIRLLDCLPTHMITDEIIDAQRKASEDEDEQGDYIYGI